MREKINVLVDTDVQKKSNYFVRIMKLLLSFKFDRCFISNSDFAVTVV